MAMVSGVTAASFVRLSPPALVDDVNTRPRVSFDVASDHHTVVRRSTCRPHMSQVQVPEATWSPRVESRLDQPGIFRVNFAVGRDR